MSQINSVELHENRLLVRLLEKNRRTPGGIELPDISSSEHIRRAEVLAVGPGLTAYVRESDEKLIRIPMRMKVGDVVLIHQDLGIPVVLDGQELKIIKDNEVPLTLRE
jgi:co-chaperonin GroES (HSP10)